MKNTHLTGLFAVILWCSTLSSAGGASLTIGSGSTVDINGGDLRVNCQEIVIRDGGTLLLQNGRLVRKNLVTIEAGGTYSVTGGTEVDCSDRSFFLIFTNEGRPVIYCLPKS